jgi:serine/threonine-protein kinase
MPTATHQTTERFRHLEPSVRLRVGAVVRNAASGRDYKIEKLLGVGGMGAVYRVVQVGGSPWPLACCLKVTTDPEFWHSEAYFGQLLQNAPGVIRVLETFAWVPKRKDALPLYCLVSELAELGDLVQFLNSSRVAWKERVARRQIIQLARTVQLLHAAGAVHRDITPSNVFVTRHGQLKLGDFGVASHRVGNREVSANIFNPSFAQTIHVKKKIGSWKPADDVYHLGQIFAFLLQGTVEGRLNAQAIKNLACSPEAKSVIQRSIGRRAKRFVDAAAMLSTLERHEKRTPKLPAVRSLRGRRVVFTGTLAIQRAEAARLLRKAGGIIQPRVNQETDIVVIGEQSPHWIAERKGRKLLDVDRERELGHPVATITERRFRTLILRA